MSPLINILTDYKQNSLEDAELIAAIYSANPESKILANKSNFETTSTIGPAMYLKLLIDKFPANTIHLIDTKISSNLPEEYMICYFKKQFIIGPNNGIIPLLAEGEDTIKFGFNQKPGKFISYARDIAYIGISLILEANFEIENIAMEHLKKTVASVINPAPFDGTKFNLQILYFDENGDAFLNLKKDEFEAQIGQKKFRIRLSINNSIEKISPHYTVSSPGDVVAVFHSSGYLQLICHHGSAKQLLGFNKHNPIILQVWE